MSAARLFFSATRPWATIFSSFLLFFFPSFFLFLSLSFSFSLFFFSFLERDSPRTTTRPSLTTYKTALAIPVRRKGSSRAVLASDIAATFGPVLEVISTLASLQVVTGSLTRSRSRHWSNQTKCTWDQGDGCEKGKSNHDEVCLMCLKSHARSVL